MCALHYVLLTTYYSLLPAHHLPGILWIGAAMSAYKAVVEHEVGAYYIHLLPTTYCLLLTAYYLLLTTYDLLLTTYYLLLATHYYLP